MKLSVPNTSNNQVQLLVTITPYKYDILNGYRIKTSGELCYVEINQEQAYWRATPAPPLATSHWHLRASCSQPLCVKYRADAPQATTLTETSLGRLCCTTTLTMTPGWDKLSYSPGGGIPANNTSGVSFDTTMMASDGDTVGDDFAVRGRCLIEIPSRRLCEMLHTFTGGTAERVIKS